MLIRVIRGYIRSETSAFPLTSWVISAQADQNGEKSLEYLEACIHLRIPQEILDKRYRLFKTSDLYCLVV